MAAEESWMEGYFKWESTDASKLVHSAYVVKEYHQGGQTLYHKVL